MRPQASTPNTQRLEMCAFLTSIFQKTNVVQDKCSQLDFLLPVSGRNRNLWLSPFLKQVWTMRR